MTSFDVLVVDDEQDIRTYLQTILQEEGLTVRCVPSATEALALIQQEKPQLIVLDLMMPEMPGDELCRIIKSDPALKDIVDRYITFKLFIFCFENLTHSAFSNKGFDAIHAISGLEI